MPNFTTVTAPIAHWYRLRPDALAIADGEQSLSFSALADAVGVRSRRISAEGLPAIAWVGADNGEIGRLLEFCAIVETGRAAAVAEPDWPPAQRTAAQSALPRTAFAEQPPGPDRAFYVGFTSGSTSVPKGFVRSHRSWTESFRVALASFGPAAAERVLAPGRLSHSLFLFASLLGLWTGAGVHLQNRFAPALCLDLLAAGAAGCLVAVPSQLLLILEAARRRREPPIGTLRLVLIGGARWPRSETMRLRALFPNARIVEFYGASETSFVAWTDSDPELPEIVVGHAFEGVDVRVRDADSPGDAGVIFVRSPMLFDDYISGDDGGLLRHGDWVSVGDMGFLDPLGRLVLLGRQRRMIVTSGRNVFPEEIESVLEAHPAVAAASVLGVPDAVRGAAVWAVVQPRAAIPPAQAALAARCRALLPPWKVPRKFVICPDWPRTAGGKTDHARLAALYGRCRT